VARRRGQNRPPRQAQEAPWAADADPPPAKGTPPGGAAVQGAPWRAGTTGNAPAPPPDPARRLIRWDRMRFAPTPRCCNSRSPCWQRGTSVPVRGTRWAPRHCTPQSAPPATPPRGGAAACGAVCGSLETAVNAYCLCMLWSIAGMSPILAPGAVWDTGSVSSALVSAPLASLNTRVMGIVVSFCRATFKSISMTW
jgi:hypothetical protein